MSIVPSKVFEKYNEFVQHFLDDFGVKCLLVYTDRVQTINESLSPLKQKKTMNLVGTPESFSRGDENYKTIETTEEITLRVYWGSADYLGDNDSYQRIGNIAVPAGTVVCYGLMKDLHKLEKANKLIIYSSLTPDHREWVLEKTSEPIPHGLTKTEVISFWKRING